MNKNTCQSRQYLKNLIAGGTDNLPKVFDCLIDIAEYNKDKDLDEFARLTQHEYNKLRRDGLTAVQHNNIVLRVIRSINDLPDSYFPNDNRSEPTLKDIYLSLLEELAAELASNYYQVSFGETAKRNGGIRHENIFTEKGSEQSIPHIGKKRNILIIGAGATHASCPYIPFGEGLKQYLEASLKFDKTKIGVTDNENIESYLGKVHNELPKELTEKIYYLYNRKFLPTHLYEIIAHLFKHQFIDVILNFNFDELLDEAIGQELGKSQYIKVFNESQCENIEKILIDGRLRTPIYIKIHGTASTKSSLKFTNTQQFEVPHEIKNYVKKLIRGQMKDSESTEDDDRIPSNIICLGFDVERANFYNDFLKDNLKAGSKFFLINWNKEIKIEDNYLKPFFQTDNEKKQYRHIALDKFSEMVYTNKNTNIPPMADLFYFIWNECIQKYFREAYKPRSIDRHEIISDIFYNAFEHGSHEDYQGGLRSIDNKYRELESYFHSKEYYFERAIVETAITLTRNKGLIEPRVAIKEEKLGKYYGLYKGVFDTFPEMYPEFIPLNKIYTDCFKLEERYSFSNNLLNLSRFNAQNDHWDDKDYITLKGLGYKEGEGIDKVSTFLNDPNNEHILILFRMLKYLERQDSDIYNLHKMRFKEDNNQRKVFFTKIANNFKGIRSGYTYDITPRFTDQELFYFESVRRRNIAHTNLALTYNFSNTLDSIEDWNILLLISERGKFVANQLSKTRSESTKNRLNNKLIVVVACYEAVAEYLNLENPTIEELAKAYKKSQGLEKANVDIHFLPYWRHHHHMAMFLKKRPTPSKKNKVSIMLHEECYFEVIKSIYYFKQGFSNKINPIVLPVESDNQIEYSFIENDNILLVDTFIAHYIKSLIFEKDMKSIPVLSKRLSYQTTIDGEEIDILTKNTILHSFDKKLKKRRGF